MEVRGDAGAPDLCSLMRTVALRIQAINREYIYWSETLQSAMNADLAEERMVATLLTFFALCALGAGRVDVFQSILQEAVA
jgi:hypothetical protein